MNLSNAIFLGTLAAAFTAGCSADVGEVDTDPTEEDTATAEQPITGWLGPISEESDRNSKRCGPSPANVGIQQARCTGSYCDNVYLYCKGLPPGITTNTTAWWTPYISEETGRSQISCESGGAGTGIDGVVDGMKITGSYGDNISLSCRKLNPLPRSMNCAWTGYFSEEGDNMVDFGVGKFAAGVRCRGPYCDSMSYQVCSFAL